MSASDAPGPASVPARRRQGAARALALVLAASLGATACGESPRLVVSWDARRVEAELPTVMAALEARTPRRALDELDRLAAEGRLPEGATHFRALALTELGRVDEALAAWEDELEEHPGNGRAHALLAQLLLDRGALDRAARHLQEARRHAPDFGPLLLLEGRLAMLRDDDERAARAFRDALARDPYGAHAPEAYLGLAQILARRGPEGAAEAKAFEELGRQLQQVQAYLARFEERLSADPDDVDAAYGVAAAYLNLYTTVVADRELLRQVEPALAHVLEREPRHARALYNMGFVRLEQQRDEEAEQLLRASISADPEFAAARINLGTLLLKHGDAEAAAEELGRALEAADTDEDRVRAHLQLGRALAVREDREALRSALDHFRQVQALHPDGQAALQAEIDAVEARLAAPDADASGAGQGAGQGEAGTPPR